MDVTRDSSPRPDPLPAGLPDLSEIPASGTHRFRRTVAQSGARPLIRSTVPPESDAERTTPQAVVTLGPPERTPALDRPRAAPIGRDLAQAAPADTTSARRPPRADTTLKERPAVALRGWLAVLFLLIAVGSVLATLARSGVLPLVEPLPDLRTELAQETGAPDLTLPALAAVSAGGLLTVFLLAGLLVNGSGETRVLSRWGRYRGTVRRTGLVWVNPFSRRRRVDVRLRHWRSEPVQVADRLGMPILVRLLVVWRVRDTARAALGIGDHETYLREQVEAVLTRTAAALPCDSGTVPGPALRDGHWFADSLTRALAAEAAPAGLDVYSVQPLGLEYAPEVADSMRRRRMADLDGGLRTAMVDDAVEAAALAVRRLERATSHELDDATRHSLMEQLLVALVAPAGVTAAVPAPAARSAARKEGRTA